MIDLAKTNSNFGSTARDNIIEYKLNNEVGAAVSLKKNWPNYEISLISKAGANLGTPITLPAINMQGDLTKVWLDSDGKQLVFEFTEMQDPTEPTGENDRLVRRLYCPVPELFASGGGSTAMKKYVQEVTVPADAWVPCSEYSENLCYNYTADLAISSMHAYDASSIPSISVSEEDLINYSIELGSLTEEDDEGLSANLILLAKNLPADAIKLTVVNLTGAEVIEVTPPIPPVHEHDLVGTLSWVEPNDLDLHLLATAQDGSTIHVFYDEPSGDDGNITLTQDITSGHGIETITIHSLKSGSEYLCWVHVYSAGYTFVPEDTSFIINYKGTTENIVFPSEQLVNQRYWILFRVNTVGQLEIINELSNTNPLTPEVPTRALLDAYGNRLTANINGQDIDLLY